VANVTSYLVTFYTKTTKLVLHLSYLVRLTAFQMLLIDELLL